jgi:hypothetical protein
MKDLTSVHIHSKLSVYADTVAKITAPVRNQVGPKMAVVGDRVNLVFMHQWQRINE